MKKNYTYNNLVWFYNRSRRKLKSLIAAGKNLRKQDIIEKRLIRLHRLLKGMQTALRTATVTAAVATGMVLLQPTTANAQSFGPVQTNPFALTGVVEYSTPAFVDLDNDGDLDMMTGEYGGNFTYFQNTGTNMAPAFGVAQTNPFGLTNTGYYSNPTFADLDNDGDLDMMTGSYLGSFGYFQNTGTNIAPAFGAVQTNPFGLTSMVNRSAPTFTDLDNDGDLDMMAGDYDVSFKYYMNTGTNVVPAFGVAQTSPFGLTNIGYYSNPTFVDLDNDGDLDMMGGVGNGNFAYFQNTGTNEAPAFGATQTNPFGLTNIGDMATTTLADLDNDGDLDMMSGDSDGNFKYFENTSVVTGIREANTSDITIYPTLVFDEITVESRSVAVKEISVFNMAGQMVLSQTVSTSKHTVNMASLTAGVYIVALTDANDNQQRNKIVKQ